MAPPTPIGCTAPDCDWKTPTNCPNWEQMVRFLELHLVSAHNMQVNAPQAPAAAPTSKLEKLPRPTFNLDMTEAEWSFTESQWKAYIE